MHFFKVVWSNPTNSTMWTDRVVIGFDVAKNSSFSFLASMKVLEMNKFTFQAVKEIFSNGIVIGIATFGHALSYVMLK